jgi:BRO1-like domain
MPILFDRVSVPESSAGTFSYLKAHAWPRLRDSISEEDELPLDLSETFLTSLELFMLAQAQECVWQWAVMGTITRIILIGRFLAPNLGRNSNGTIAKLAAQVGYPASDVLSV